MDITKKEEGGDIVIYNKDGVEINRYPKLPPVPPGMSKNEWKRVFKKQRHLETKDQFSLKRREKKKEARLRKKEKIRAIVESGQEIPVILKKAKINRNQTDSGIKIILDCAFDDLMNNKEIVSMTNQLTRAFSSNRRENYFANVTVTSFNKRLKKRFDNELVQTNYPTWTHFEFLEDEKILTDPSVDKSKMIYLTADTDEKLETLESGMTYVVGGIVDKNRYPALCYNKAKELGIPTKRLPIDEFIKVSGRKVLTTTHVIQLMLKYFDNHDWKEAFEAVLPTRIQAKEGEDGEEEENENEKQIVSTLVDKESTSVKESKEVENKVEDQ